MTAAAAASSSSAVSSASADSVWLYIDDDGVERGPFSSAQMLAWYEQGYFSAEQLCKQQPPSVDEGGAVSSFRPMSSCFPPAMQRAKAAQQQQQRQPKVEAESAASDSAVYEERKERESEASAEEGEQPQEGSGAEGAKQQIDAASNSDEAKEKERQDGGEQEEEDQEAEDEDEGEEEEEEQDPEVAARLAALRGSTSGQQSAPSRPAGGESEHSWTYIDDSGAVQGPFPSSHMQAWHTAGYFKPHTKVRRDDESDMTELQHRKRTDFIAAPSTPTTATTAVSSTPSPPAPPVAARPTVKLYTPEPGETDWYYTDRAGIERGPFSTSLMRHWHSKGYFTYNDCPIRPAHVPSVASAPLRLQTTAPDFVLPPHHPTAATAAIDQRLQPQRSLQDEQWLYLDSVQQHQGPFSTAAMADWWRAGYLPASTQVKRVGEQQWSTIAERGHLCSFAQPAATATSRSLAHHYHNQPAWERPSQPPFRQQYNT